MSDKKDIKEPEVKNELSDVEKATAIAVQTFLSFQQANAPKQREMPTIPTGTQCNDCGQPGYVGPQGLKFSCGGKHTKMIVFPQKYPKWFPGMCLNGTWYKSNHGGHTITVPADNDFAQGLQRWDQQEEEYRNGRTHTPSQYNPINRG